MKRFKHAGVKAAATLLFIAMAAPVFAQVQRATPGDSDQTLRAMRDEMERSREKLRIAELDRPYYIEYRLLDINVRTVTSSFGAIITSNTAGNRVMSVEVRVGDYKLDSSNFVADDLFQGFIGNTGTVGIDRDYESLRQDLWLATDQAYKSALDSIARKRAYIRNLARASDIDDFSREQPVVLVNARQEPNWTGRNWEEEAKAASAVFREYPQLYSSRVTYHLVNFTYYLLTSEGTQIRVSRNLSSIEAGIEAQSDDGMRVHNFYTAYVNQPSELPQPAAVRGEMERISRELMALRTAPLAADYAGPVLVEAPAAGALLAQMLGPSVSGARAPLSMMPFFEQMMERMGGRSEWSGRMATRVLPGSVSLLDDPTAREFQSQPLIGWYDVDEEGVRGQKVTLVENGMLRRLLMSRRPGSEFQQSNGHGRAAFLNDAKPAIANLFVQASETLGPAEMRKKFLELCKAEGRTSCILVRQMDHPVLGVHRQQDFAEVFAGIGGPGGADRAPLLIYRVNVEDGKEELIRGAWLSGVNLRSLRNVAAVGSDPAVYNFYQDVRIAGTALGAFGTAQGGMPSSIVSPSLLLSEAEVRGARREPQKPPMVPPPPLKSED